MKRCARAACPPTPAAKPADNVRHALQMILLEVLCHVGECGGGIQGQAAVLLGKSHSDTGTVANLDSVIILFHIAKIVLKSRQNANILWLE